MRIIPGYSQYLVSEDGEIYSLRWERLIKHYRDKDGYHRVSIRRDDDGKQYPVGVHKLVALAFHGAQPSVRHQVRHLDGDKDNNRESNIAWGASGAAAPHSGKGEVELN